MVFLIPLFLYLGCTKYKYSVIISKVTQQEE